jgi:hypothetical protein
MQSNLSPSSLTNDERYEQRTCGMDRELLVKVRAAEKDIATLDGFGRNFAAAVRSHIKPLSANVGVMIGPAFGKQACLISTGDDPEIVVWLLLDPLDVDSKQVTFVRSQDPGLRKNGSWKQEEVFKGLYKFAPEI